ncbi:hypothetical protein CW696_07650 [ANME-2 cluster archaeon]|nr:MAG: hypothetical protein CW696_07650 [ANME-2 cluster archaeon]
MADIEDVISAFPEDYETESSSPTNPERETHNKCWLAMKAAWDTLAEYCGGPGVPVNIEGMTVSAPPEVIKIAHSNPELTREERIAAIAESEWGRNTAAGMCEKLFGAEPGTSEHERCVESTAKRLAKGLID